jgi:hypothetical protein
MLARKLVLYPWQRLKSSMASENSESVIVKLDAHLMDALDKICEEWGIRSRADLIERLLEEVLAPESSKCQPTDPNSTQGLEGGN